MSNFKLFYVELQEIQNRLEHKDKYVNWTLIATSCVESGLNLSFRNGFCEFRSSQSAFQISGRLNRDCEYDDSVLYCFKQSIPGFINNKSFDSAIRVFDEQITYGDISNMNISDVITQSFDMECKRDDTTYTELIKKEKLNKFKDIANDFKIIDDDTVTVIANNVIIDRLISGQTITSHELIRGSVGIRRSYLRRLEIIKIGSDELLGFADGQYDSFLGYAYGLLK